MIDTEPLISLVYSSVSTSQMNETDLGQLLAQSRENNSRAGVTGMLLYRGGRFIQVLEGAETTVSALVSRIEADRRHSAVRVLLREPLQRRQFADWTMGYEPISAPRQELPEAFRDTFLDLEEAANPSSILRAVRELTLWFRVRSRASA